MVVEEKKGSSGLRNLGKERIKSTKVVKVFTVGKFIVIHCDWDPWQCNHLVTICGIIWGKAIICMVEDILYEKGTKTIFVQSMCL